MTQERREANALFKKMLFSEASGTPAEKSRTARNTTVRRSPWYLGPDKNLDPPALDKYEKKGGYILEPKADGMWAMLEVKSPKDGEPHVLNSRDARTGPISGANLGDLHMADLRFPAGTILVGELEAATQHAAEQVAQNGYRRFFLFDMPRYGADDLRGASLRDRRVLLNEACENGLKTKSVCDRFLILPLIRKNFRDAYQQLVEGGMEGIVLKKETSKYRTNRSDGKTDNWLRCKKQYTHDYVLMGTEYTKGGEYSAPQVTGVWGLYKKGKLTRAFQGTCPEGLLVAENFGVLVAEFMGWQLFKSGALRHAQFVRVRLDKPPRDCTL